MTVADADSVSARPRPRLFGVHAELALAFSLLPVVRIWDLTDDLNTSVSTAALFAGAAYLIWQLTAFRPPVCSRSARATAAALLAACAWQLAWIDSNDFWFFRIALIVWAAGWLLLWWGWRGPAYGWRVLTAFVVWSATCDGPWRWMRDGYQDGLRFAPAITGATAQSAGWLLRVFGHPASVHANKLVVFGETVSVGLTCTSLPLTKLLLLLLALAVLLFRMPWGRAAALAAAAVAAAFAIAVIRVVLLACVAHDPQRFHYWHEPGSGGQWFTAAGMVALALLFARALPAYWRPPPPSGEAAPNAGRGIAVAGVLVLAAARLTTPAPPPSHFVDTPPAGYSLQGDVSESMDLGPGGGAHPNEPSWLRRITLQGTSAGARLELTLAYVPQMLAGDLRPEPGPWRLDPGAKYAVLVSPRRVVWVSTIAPDGFAVATDAAWDRKVDEGLNHPERWLQWLAHLRPLRDKRAYWAEAIWTGPAAERPRAPPLPFSHWIGLTTPAPDGPAVPRPAT